MKNFFLTLFFTTLIITVSTSCDPVRKLAKSDNIADKDSAAIHYYKKKKYDQAVYLFEELIAIYRGTPRSEEMYYYYAYCRYYLGELISASFYFEDYVKQYPTSEHAEEFQYLHAYCFYLLSDPPELDQKYTIKAIEKIQLFLSRYPESTKKAKCNELIFELRERLAKKSFEKANLYLKIGYFKAAVEAFSVLMEKYPDSDFREEAQFLSLKAAHKLAGISVDSKKTERYLKAQESYEGFVSKYPESSFKGEAQAIKAATDKELEKSRTKDLLKEEEKLFTSFRREMNKAIDQKGTEEGTAVYEKALAHYDELKSKNPNSKYIRDAEKVFAEFEKAKEIN